MTTAAPVGWRHRAWLVAGVTFVALLASAGVRASTGVFIQPVSDEFGWSTATVSVAVTVNLVLYGLVAPFAAAFMERFGVRRVVAFALTLLAAGMGLSTLVQQPWQLVMTWGVLVGFGIGSMALVFGAIVAQRWFYARRNLVTGLFSAGTATGNLLFLPVVARLTDQQGWRVAALLLAVFSLLAIPVVLLLLRERPADVGLLPYGAPAGWHEEEAAPTGSTAARTALLRLREASGTRAFWLLALGFFVCGWSTNGLIATHFVPAAHDHGMPPVTAASLLALIGLFDIVGTVGSGWLTDRYDARWLLVGYYGLRGVSLLLLHTVWAATVQPPMFFFVVLYGLDWVATVPPTVALCREAFGLNRAGVIFGWVYASHMIGAGISAVVAGGLRDVTGSYDIAWWVAGALCLVAAAASAAIPRGNAFERTSDREPEVSPV